MLTKAYNILKGMAPWSSKADEKANTSSSNIRSEDQISFYVVAKLTKPVNTAANELPTYFQQQALQLKITSVTSPLTNQISACGSVEEAKILLQTKDKKHYGIVEIGIHKQIQIERAGTLYLIDTSTITDSNILKVHFLGKDNYLDSIENPLKKKAVPTAKAKK